MKFVACYSVVLALSAFFVSIHTGAGAPHADIPAPSRLSYFRFNTPDWLGEEGERPLEAIRATQAPSFDGNALLAHRTNGIARLKYHVVETGGRTNLDCRMGSIHFWYKPFWSSKDRMAPLGFGWGDGPGQWIRLIEIGTWTPDCSVGLFALSIGPEGTNLVLQTQNNLGQGTTNIQARISFTYPQPEISKAGPRWHEIGVLFSPEQTSLWVDGLLAATNKGIAQVPPEDVRAQGFTIGSSTAGTMPAQGLIDELEIFNYPIGEVENQMNGRVLSARAGVAPPQIQLDWRKRPDTLYSIKRNDKGASALRVLTTNLTRLSYTDRTEVVPGRRYTYQVNDSRLIAGINLPPVERRGRVMLLVDETVAQTLALELARLKEDLAGDGWQVIRCDAPRHDDSDWTANPARIARIKSMIIKEARSALGCPGTIFIIGHVAIPYSGFISPDGHPARPWPTDGYYGDVEGQWTDATNLAPSNVSQDGKFDQLFFPAPLRIAVGRVDFAQMPGLSAGGSAPKKTETDCLARYLRKDHAYRHKQFSLPDRVIVGGFFNTSEDAAIYENALVNGSRWFGFEPGKVIHGDLFIVQKPCLWGFEAGPGSPQTLWGYGAMPHSTADLTVPTREPPIAFYLLKGSYFGEWNVENNLMRALLATPTYGLTVMWTRYSCYRLETLALGDPIGAGLLDTQNDPQQPRSSPNLFLALMGDPTLRLQVTAPPVRLSGNTQASKVALTWNPALEPNTQYFVYRSSTGLDGTFTRLTADPIEQHNFTDTHPPRGSKLYQVRALQRVVTGSGSFTNLSQGVFVAVK